MHIYSKYLFYRFFGIQRYFMTVRSGTAYIPVFSGSTTGTFLLYWNGYLHFFYFIYLFFFYKNTVRSK